jgi:hypothetical protein
MTCNCLKEVPEAVKNACNEHNDYPTAVTRVEIEGVKKSSVDTDDVKLAATMRIYTQGSSFARIEPNFFTYCPFCGVKYKEDSK